ncbi:hypothetical protein DEF23_12425, partial [Marinitenerispora sediminis]
MASGASGRPFGFPVRAVAALPLGAAFAGSALVALAPVATAADAPAAVLSTEAETVRPGDELTVTLTVTTPDDQPVCATGTLHGAPGFGTAPLEAEVTGAAPASVAVTGTAERPGALEFTAVVAYGELRADGTCAEPAERIEPEPLTVTVEPEPSPDPTPSPTVSPTTDPTPTAE